MTRDVIPDSREKTYEEQCQWVEEVANNTSIPYTLPSILEGVVSTLCYYTETGKEVFPYDPPSTISRCKERLRRGYTVVFGQLHNSQISIKNFPNDQYELAGMAAAIR